MSSTDIKILKELGFLAVVFVGYCLACVWYNSRFKPDESVENYTDFKAQGISISRAVKLTNPPSHICLIGKSAPLWTLPSGSPAYHFNGKGQLIDYTTDSGDNLTFQQEYRVYSGNDFPLEDLETYFSQNNN